FLDVDKVWHGAAVSDGIGGGYKSHRRHEHFVARLYPSQLQGYVQRCRAIDNRDGVLGAGAFNECRLEASDEFTDGRDVSGVETLVGVAPFVTGEARLVWRDGAGTCHITDRIEDALGAGGANSGHAHSVYSAGR